MIDLRLIGIGTGNPDHLTRMAEQAMRTADLILLPAKRADTADLLDLRLALCDGIVGARTRIVTFDLPTRDPEAPYLAGVREWHAAIAAVWRTQIEAHLPHGGTLALLVWGDPSLYDSTLRVAARLQAGGMAMRVTVVPGITSLQALTAAHAITLNDLGAPVLVTTGRRLAEGGWPAGIDTLAVMLDGSDAYAHIDPAGVRIWWGAYLGMAAQSLIAGDLTDTVSLIRDRRAALRSQHGWIMDTYLLRRRPPAR